MRKTITVALIALSIGLPAVAYGQTNPDANKVAYWCEPDGNFEPFADTGVKYEPVDTPFIVPAPPEGKIWTLLVLKAGTTNETVAYPVVGQGYQQGTDKDNSHVILCWEVNEVTTTTSTSTSTTSTSTSTTSTSSTTTSTPSTTIPGTTTTVQPTTTSSSTTTIPATTTSPPTTDPSTTTSLDETTTTLATTTVPPVTEPTLPVTGVEVGGLGALALALLALGGLTVFAIRKSHS